MKSKPILVRPSARADQSDDLSQVSDNHPNVPRIPGVIHLPRIVQPVLRPIATDGAEEQDELLGRDQRAATGKVSSNVLNP
jgi:hypothetical protein